MIQPLKLTLVAAAAASLLFTACNKDGAKTGPATGTTTASVAGENANMPVAKYNDVTITLKDGSAVEGYIFDRLAGTTLATSTVRMFPKNEAVKRTISWSEIAGLAFTGRDTAAGKTWEAWLKKYWEKKQAGEANIELAPESLD